MSSSNRNSRSAGGVGMAVGAAFATALIGLANAPTASADGPDPFQDLFGDTGFNSWTPSADSFLASSDPTLAATLDTSVENFLTNGLFTNGVVFTPDTPFTAEAFFLESAECILSGCTGFNFPNDALSDSAVGLDYTVFASGLSPVLDPILDPLTALLLLGGGFAGL